jgi:hypothetical protein
VPPGDQIRQLPADSDARLSVISTTWHKRAEAANRTLRGMPDLTDDARRNRLAIDYFGMHRDQDPDGSVEFNLPIGEWIRVFHANGFVIEALLEPQPPEGATSTYRDAADYAWARRWPMEMVWKVRKG